MPGLDEFVRPHAGGAARLMLVRAAKYGCGKGEPARGASGRPARCFISGLSPNRKSILFFWFCSVILNPCVAHRQWRAHNLRPFASLG